MKKILTIVGARPQFVKASVVSKEIQTLSNTSEVLLHTGQHFDTNMSDIFFEQLNIPRPNYQLDINGGHHGEMTGRMLIEIEQVLLQEKPDRVLVYGDTNSTLAGALAATKLHIPVAHIEAGLRSFNMKMPEEVNRILTDQISDLLFCPTQTAMGNLEKEGFSSKAVKVLNVGDVMQDAALFFAKKALQPHAVQHTKPFALATLHRAENTDNPKRLTAIVRALNETHQEIIPVILPLHPRTQKLIKQLGLNLRCQVIDPVGYLEMIWLLQHTELVLTDSGGVQKEAFFFSKPCITMRDQTEWVELVKIGANILTGADTDKILDAVRISIGNQIKDDAQLYGGGNASKNIASILQNMT